MAAFSRPKSVDFFREPETFAPLNTPPTPAMDERERLGGFPLPPPSPSLTRGVPFRRSFTPLPFTPLYGFFLVGLMVFMAAGVEVLRYISVHQGGLSNSVVRSDYYETVHLLYTVVIVAASLPVVALWA